MSENGILGCTLKALIYKLFQLTGPIWSSAGRKGGKTVKKELRKSTANRNLRTYYISCYCSCSTHCAVETSSWYPKEAHAAEDDTVFSVNFTINNM